MSLSLSANQHDFVGMEIIIWDDISVYFAKSRKKKILFVNNLLVQSMIRSFFVM